MSGLGWESLVNLVIGAGGFVLAYLAFGRNRKSDHKDEGKEWGVALSEIGYIKANTDEIKAEQKEQRKINTELYSRLSSVEASAKQAHKRIDMLQQGGEAHE